MPSVQKSARKCATCQYWTGLRHLSTSNFIHFEDTGKCTATRSSYKGKETRGMQHCGQWMKWVAIT